MTVIYVTSGAWGAGVGAPLSAADVDGNFYDVDQRIVDLNADLAEGKRIESVTYTSNSMTFHFTDGTTQVIPLPIATLEFVGEWMNSTPYTRGHMISGGGLGIFQVLQDHTTPAPPATFDPNATADGEPLYQLWMPLRDVNYDAAVFVSGLIMRDPATLLFQGIANRSMRLPAGTEACFAYLGVGNDAVGATDIILSIEKNGTGIGTITFAAGGGHDGAFVIAAETNFVVGDRYAIRVTASDNPEPADLSITLPFLRTDI